MSVYGYQTRIIGPNGEVFLPTTPTCRIDGDLADREWVNEDVRIGWWEYINEDEALMFARFVSPDFLNPLETA